VPTDAPEADGTYAWNSTTMVMVHLEAGATTGLGYTYADESTAKLAQMLLQKVVAGRDVFFAWSDSSGYLPSCAQSWRNRYHQDGGGGDRQCDVGSTRALAGCSAGESFWMVRDGIPVYGSGGFTSYNDSQLQHQLGGWAQDGFSMVKMKVGSNPEDDPRRVEVARSAIGDQCELFVDANGAYTVTQALRLANRFAEQKSDGLKSRSAPTISLGSVRCAPARPSG